MINHMGQSTLKRYPLPRNILVVYVEDTSSETVQDWYDSSVTEMDGYTRPVKRLYDMRALPTISIEAVRAAVRIRRHPQAHFVYTAVLTHNTTVTALVKATLSVNAGGNFQLFTDEAEAIAWLHTKVPD